MRSWFLALCLLVAVLAASCDARPTFRKKRNVFKAQRRSFDELLDMDEDKVKAMAGAVSDKLGEEVSPQEVSGFLEKYGEEAEEAFYVAAEGLNAADFETFQDLLDHPDLLGDFLEELDNQGLFEDEDKKGQKKGPKKSFDELIDMDEDKVKAMAGAVSDKLGEEVTPEEVSGFLEKYGEEAEEAFYVAAEGLNAADFETFQDLLDHPDLLGDFLEELDNQGLFEDEDKKGQKKGPKKSFDELIDMDEDKVKAMAGAVSDKLGEEVTPEEVSGFLEKYGEEAEEAFYVAAEGLNAADFETFQDLLDHPDLLGDFLEELDNQGLFEDEDKKGQNKGPKKAKKSFDELLDMDEDKVKAMAGAVSDKLGEEVTPEEVSGFLEKYGEEAEEAFYVAAEGLNAADFETFQDLLDHPDLLGDFLEELDNQGLFEDEDKKGQNKGPKKAKKSFDELLDMDEDKVKAMAGAVSDKLGEEVTPEEVSGFLEKYGEEAEEAFYVAAEGLNAADFETFQDLLDHPDLLGDFLEELDNQGLFEDEDKKGQNKGPKKAKKSFDELLDMDEDKVKAMAGAVSDKLGEEVTPEEVSGFLEKYGEEAEEAFYVAAEGLNAADFETFQDLLDHPDLLGDFLEELDNQGLFEDEDKKGQNKGPKKAKKSFDELLDMDEDKVKAMAGAVSDKLGEEVTPEEVSGFLEKYGEEAEEAFYVAAEGLNAADFETFQDLLDHPDLLGDFLEELDNQGLFEDEDKKGPKKGSKKAKKSW